MVCSIDVLPAKLLGGAQINGCAWMNNNRGSLLVYSAEYYLCMRQCVGCHSKCPVTHEPPGPPPVWGMAEQGCVVSPMSSTATPRAHTRYLHGAIGR